MRDSLADLEQSFQDMIDKFPEERRKLVTSAGEKMHKKVLQNIDRDTKEKTRNLREGCYLAIGSEGGYAAVRNNHLRAPHAHLIEFGHKVKKRGKDKEKRKPKAKKRTVRPSGRGLSEGDWVQGKHMYRNAMNELEDELTQDAEKMMDRLVGEHF